MYTQIFVVSKIVSDFLTLSKSSSKTLSKSLLNPQAKIFIFKNKTQEKEINKLISSNLKLYNSRLDPQAEPFISHFTDLYPTAYLTKIKINFKTQSLDLSRDDLMSNSSYDQLWTEIQNEPRTRY